MRNKRLRGPRPAAQPAAFEAPAGRWAPSCPPFHGSRSAPLPLCLRMFGLNIHALPPSLPLVATRRPCARRCGRIWPGFGCRPAGFRPGSQLWGAGAARCLWPPLRAARHFCNRQGAGSPPRAPSRALAPPCALGARPLKWAKTMKEGQRGRKDDDSTVFFVSSLWVQRGRPDDSTS